jgi:hypothetical protein
MDFEPMKEEESPLTDSVELSKQEELAKWEGVAEAIQMSRHCRGTTVAELSRFFFLK